MHKVIFDTFKKLDKKYKYIILLQPTSPLRKLNLVRKAIKILNKNKSFDSFIHLAYEHTFTGKLKIIFGNLIMTLIIGHKILKIS